MEKIVRFCSRYRNKEAAEECQCKAKQDQKDPHIFIPTQTTYRCNYGPCSGSKCQICDKFQYVG